MNSVTSEMLLDESLESESFLPILFESADDISEESNEEVRNISIRDPLANVIIHKPNKSYTKADKCLEISKENKMLYCYCNSVEYGKMECCDNQNCKIGWFHFGSVGIKYKPGGDWFCKNCK